MVPSVLFLKKRLEFFFEGAIEADDHPEEFSHQEGSAMTCLRRVFRFNISIFQQMLKVIISTMWCDIWPPPCLGRSVQTKTHPLCQPSITREYLLQPDITKLRHCIAPTTSSVTLVIGPSWSCHAVQESFRVVQSYTKLCWSGVLQYCSAREGRDAKQCRVRCPLSSCPPGCPPDPILRSNVHWPLPPHRIARYTVQC